MAKQFGIHQLRGKVGEMSYYRQSGVDGGLVRSINAGMSSRVKTGAEYANTRLNNSEFGQACRIAGVLGASVTPKWRPMILPFSQSKLAKEVLKLIKLDKTSGSTWGTRSISQADVQSCVNSLNGLAKNPFDRFFSEVSIADGETTVPGHKAIDIPNVPNADIDAYLGSIDAQEIRMYVNIYDFSVGRFDEKSGSYGEVKCNQLGQLSGDFQNLSDFPLDVITYRGVYSKPDLTAVGGLLVNLVAVPLRNVNGTKFELQEYASFRNFLHLPA